MREREIERECVCVHVGERESSDLGSMLSNFPLRRLRPVPEPEEQPLRPALLRGRRQQQKARACKVLDFRVNKAQIRQSRPDSGLGVQVKVLKTS